MLTIVLENTDFGSIIGSPQAPNTNALASACGLATNYHGIQFPSLPNYLALTSGQVPPAIAGDGVTGRDCQPAPDLPEHRPEHLHPDRHGRRGRDRPGDGAHLAHVRREHARQLRPCELR